MKILTIALAVAVIAGVGCRSHRVVVIQPSPHGTVKASSHLTEREKEAVRAAIGVRPPVIPQPPMTLSTRFAAICPYCNEINLNFWAGNSGGQTVKAGDTITLRTGRYSTNIVAEVDGNIEQWQLSYQCWNCDMGFGTARDQFVPIYTSVRLPIRE